MPHPERWRDTCDPFALPYRTFRPTEILGYPHAGNDVFHARGLYQGAPVTAYIKVARQKSADLANELRLLRQLDAPCFPRVLDGDDKQGSFSVTAELPGSRLSVILGEKHASTALPYMEAYGEALAMLHRMHPVAAPQKERRFHHPPSDEQLAALGLSRLATFFADRPRGGRTVFCHGDFHYANVLWAGDRPSAILDFELSGWGDRDFDIAWALFLRPGQQFLKTREETERFLAGYRRLEACDERAVRYYMAQCYVHFLALAGSDHEYADDVRAYLSAL